MTTDRATIHQGDVLEYCAAFDGKPFHAVLCDPPYHLTSIVKRFANGEPEHTKTANDIKHRLTPHARQAAGFMGKQWDGGDVAFRPETWAAIASVCYPGALIMAFAGTRGYHRQAVAMEDAGLILHPMICWAFGCLSEDTEILTKTGWEPYHKAIEGTEVLCYNNSDDTYSFQTVQEICVYDYNETAYRIHSDRTDQIVSRNHRCLVERANGFEFVFAERLAAQETVPILAGVSDLLESLRGPECGRIPQEENLRVGMRESCDREEEHRQEEAGSGAGYRDTTLRLLRQGNNAVPFPLEKGALCVLLSDLSGQRQRLSFSATRRERKGQTTAGQRVEGCEEPGMEGRRNLHAEAWQLPINQVCEMPRRVSVNGAKRRVRDGASADCGSGTRQTASAVGSGTSCEPRCDRQPDRESGTVCVQSGTQTVRASRFTETTLAEITPIHYQGKVWCVRVPTGAFVARRNGRIFVTGNSGFPKATRLDTQIDKAAGADRATGKVRKGAVNPNGYKTDGVEQSGGPFRAEFTETLPATDLAKAWAGHRYGLQALKPSLECIAVAQVPYKGKPRDCMVDTGAGAFNVDAGRVGSESVKTQGGKKFPALYGTYADCPESERSGRWPANLILDESAAALMDSQSGETRSCDVQRNRQTLGSFGMPNTTTSEYADSGGASRFFFRTDWNAEEVDPFLYCAKAGRGERDAGLEGMPMQPKKGHIQQSEGRKMHGDTETFPCRNPHPTVKPLRLMRYLASLLLPPEEYASRRLFVPFAGSGSEMCGALLAGWESVTGVEMSEEYAEIARARLAFWQGNVGLFEALTAEEETEPEQMGMEL